MIESGDYISREAVEKVFSQPVTMSMCLTLEECKQKNAQRQIDLFVIRGLPSADVRPVVHGKWVNDHNGKYSPAGDNYFCSACKDPSLRAFGKPARTNFCPNCGADMREANDEKA